MEQMKRQFRSEMERCRALVESRLREAFRGGGLEEAMSYSLLAGGKRIRPILVIKFCQAMGGTEKQAIGPACGVEMLHTYSLIHDDLPCMDNDDLRRGKPTCHKVFGECTATLAGDALQAAAFEWVLSGGDHRLGLELARAVGASGMCLGQYLDMEAEGHTPTVDELSAIHEKKTAALLRCACRIGVLCAPRCGGTDAALAAADEYASHLGMAFQIRDDMLDVTACAETLGKSIGSDAANGKHTFASLRGIDACSALVEEHTALARRALKELPGDTSFLDELAEALAVRSY